MSDRPEVIVLNERVVKPHSARSAPRFGQPVVRCADPWDHVLIELRQKRASQTPSTENTILYWEQARHFYHASRVLPQESSPLTSYYCMLNAAKALLSDKGQLGQQSEHGVTRDPDQPVGLALERIRLRTSASFINKQGILETSRILPTLAQFLDRAITYTRPDGKLESKRNVEIPLTEALSQLAYVHRAYTISLSAAESFIPLDNPRFMKGSREGVETFWFQAQIDPQYLSLAQSRQGDLSPDWELDGSVLRGPKANAEWDESDACQLLTSYQKGLRKRVMPIRAAKPRWYYRLPPGTPNSDLSQSILALGAMHLLSELSRYEPIRLHGYLKSKEGWLLFEFLRIAPAQFVYAMASELTGYEYMPAEAFSLPN